ncbi:hypothetical protein MRB53_007251 [Persea americana]|uniref:Uncharacterized protein n=1 Tax=Persea americana TaxID=3435 RepID=A0ACC2MIP0_PERAE|nr:hypothetical protein MRB53_007251 [Persea americana]|eukprot:TRINITY_DN15036_c0_g1_i1.p1 TRINITY_DN15036_c0_g1~~TRINITY_DN15036_c0_g1_i1.p1  ORF type:complete len:136 (-),score=15.72 TRINITY_DN15036_c0_g1_i1:133-540(-)
MDGHDQTLAHHVDTSRPDIGFPFGMALLLLVVFSLSGIFSCCYHWDKIRSLSRHLSADTDTVTETATVQYPSKSTPADVSSKQNHSESLPVLMPGDQIPKYIARPCTCDTLVPLEKIIVIVQTPPSTPLWPAIDL